MGALISSTFLTLVVVPPLYTLFDDLAVWLERVIARRPPKAATTPLEPISR